MPEMNPVIQTLMALIQAKQQDEERFARNKQAKDQLALQLKQLTEQTAIDRAKQTLAEAEARQRAEEAYRTQVLTGARSVQGLEIPQAKVPLSLPKGDVPYDYSPEELASRFTSKFVPFTTQYFRGPLGIQEVTDVVPYEKARAQKLEELEDMAKLAGRQVKYTTEAKEKAETPWRKVELDAAQYAIERRGEIQRMLQESEQDFNRRENRLDRISREALGRMAISAGLGGLGALGGPLLSSAYLASIGEADLTGNAPAVLAQRDILTRSGRVPVSTKDSERLTTSQQAYTLLQETKDLMDMLPERSKGMLGLVGSAVQARFWGTDLRNRAKQLKGRAAEMAVLSGEKGNKSEGDIMRALGRMFDEIAYKDQGFERYWDLKRDFDLTLIESGMRNMPEGQRVEMLLKIGFDPNTIDSQVRKPKEYIQQNQSPYMPKYFYDEKEEQWYALHIASKKYKPVSPVKEMKNTATTSGNGKANVGSSVPFFAVDPTVGGQRPGGTQ